MSERTLRRVVFAGMLSVCVSAALGQEREEAPAMAEEPNQVTGEELTPETVRAIERGMKWLAAKQARDGSFGGGGMSAQSAVTSLSAIAFMSGGSLPGRGPYGENVEKAADYIMNSSQRSGLLSSDASHGVMYSHGFATLFLAELYGKIGRAHV